MLEAGKNPTDAAVSEAQTPGASMLNGTLTTIAAFVPLLIAMDGVNREFIYRLPTTLSVMLAVGWVLAMTSCVILAAWFIRPPNDPSKPSATLPWLMARLSSVAIRKQIRRTLVVDEATSPDVSHTQTIGEGLVTSSTTFFMDPGCDRIDRPDAYRHGNHRHVENESTSTDPSPPSTGRNGRTPSRIAVTDEP
jgi:hypothetical protein